jgi:hypothetical protein
MSDKEDEKEFLICGGGVHCLKLNDKEHSTQFIHLKPVNFSFLSFMDTFSFDLICFVFCFSLFSQSEQIDD